jgi:hypothetical protein
MAKRSRRARRGRRSTLGAAQAALGGYLETGGKQVNETVMSFLSMFETGHLIGALRKQALAAGRSVGISGGQARRSRKASSRPRRRSVKKSTEFAGSRRRATANKRSARTRTSGARRRRGRSKR